MDEGIIIGYIDGEVLSSKLGAADGNVLSSLDGFFVGYNYEKPVGVLLGDSLA